jgi:hypothetical protein
MQTYKRSESVAPPLLSALDGGEWSASRPCHFTPGGKEPPVRTGQEARWTSEPVWTLLRREKSFALARNQTSAVRPVAHRYTELSWFVQLKKVAVGKISSKLKFGT